MILKYNNDSFGLDLFKDCSSNESWFNYFYIVLQAIIEDVEQRQAALEAVRQAAEEMLRQPGLDSEAAKGKFYNFFYLYMCVYYLKIKWWPKEKIKYILENYHFNFVSWLLPPNNV